MPKVSALNMPDVPMGQLPPHLELQRTRVSCDTYAPTHTENIQSSGAYTSVGVENSLRLNQFRKNFRFDMIGIDPSVAKAFRRILISEVPTMAIEKVLIVNSTTLVQDEVLAHRLGLIPIKADPRLFEYMSENDTPNENNTIVFKLHAKCKRGGPRLKVCATSSSRPKPETEEKPYTSFSCNQASMLQFVNNPIVPKHPDIIISKLGPGQEIELEAHAVKGMGKTHAKWSPVSTAWYRMLPEVVLLQDIEDELAEELVKKCPGKVFDIEDLGKGKMKATVARQRSCTLCRECIREENWEKRVSLRRVKDHFIFKIESSGALPPEELFTEAVKILEEKCQRVIAEMS
ncbi:hypothetical protein MKX01_040213 [Papaver californicum]|nr:hypothetical protein MKX01_040213 [Papaver californicum]